MKNAACRYILCLFALLLLSGCPAALVVGGAAVGAGTGTFFYVNGELKTEYFAPFDRVWTACEKAVADLRGTDVQPVKELAQGSIAAMINDEKVKIEVTYRAKNQT